MRRDLYMRSAFDGLQAPAHTVHYQGRHLADPRNWQLDRVWGNGCGKTRRRDGYIGMTS
jgi:hypothetical protein